MSNNELNKFVMQPTIHVHHNFLVCFYWLFHIMSVMSGMLTVFYKIKIYNIIFADEMLAASQI
jgi:hypothetical protein